MKNLLALSLLIYCAATFADSTSTDHHFNILVYHSVSENTPASTSVTTERFREHLQFLADNRFKVISLADGLNAIQNNLPLPKNSVAITFDDGYRNIYDNAWPLLSEFNYPFTVFIDTDSIDDQYSNRLTWQQIREMKSAGVTFANHSRDHAYLVRQPARNEAWATQVMKNIEYAQNRLIDELGEDVPKWFAYPYGEFSTELRQLLKNQGYIAFGQHSGGVWPGSDMQALPRFAAAGLYSNLTTLKVKLASRPMPVDESLLPDMLTTEKRPSVDVTLTTLANLNKNMNCFIDGQPTQAQWLSNNRFRVTADSDLSEGRHRFNCTSLALDGSYFYWLSKPWLVYELER